jgi:hypothetical protein
MQESGSTESSDGAHRGRGALAIARQIDARARPAS